VKAQRSQLRRIDACDHHMFAKPGGARSGTASSRKTAVEVAIASL
jgi:hypothetical protein